MSIMIKTYISQHLSSNMYKSVSEWLDKHIELFGICSVEWNMEMKNITFQVFLTTENHSILDKFEKFCKINKNS